ncbi:MAG: hypothetical protein JXB23_16820 [Candidatus Aminicenantes bacterium]|nr:hypothetical protein [Candidatus Aminicenantes bacterium]
MTEEKTKFTDKEIATALLCRKIKEMGAMDPDEVITFFKDDLGGSMLYKPRAQKIIGKVREMGDKLISKKYLRYLTSREIEIGV